MVRIMSLNYSLVWVFYNWPYYIIFIQFFVLHSYKTIMCSLMLNQQTLHDSDKTLTSFISKTNTTDCKRKCDTRLMHHIINMIS